MKRLLPLLCGLLMLAGCAGKQIESDEQAVAIGPYPAFNGRLIVIEPARRWQTLIDWQAKEPSQGQLRLTHAATGTVIEFRWQRGRMWLRSNREPQWRPIAREQLAEQGIVIPPQELAAILLGHMPAPYRPTATNEWENHENGTFIRVAWHPEQHKLKLTDIRHGRIATLLIQP